MDGRVQKKKHIFRDTDLRKDMTEKSTEMVLS